MPFELKIVESKQSFKAFLLRLPCPVFWWHTISWRIHSITSQRRRQDLLVEFSEWWAFTPAYKQQFCTQWQFRAIGKVVLSSVSLMLTLEISCGNCNRATYGCFPLQASRSVFYFGDSCGSCISLLFAWVVNLGFLSLVLDITAREDFIKSFNWDYTV